jgi:hypothetical protein
MISSLDSRARHPHTRHAQKKELTYLAPTPYVTLFSPFTSHSSPSYFNNPCPYTKSSPPSFYIPPKQKRHVLNLPHPHAFKITTHPYLYIPRAKKISAPSVQEIKKQMDAVGIEPTTFHKLHWIMRSELTELESHIHTNVWWM